MSQDIRDYRLKRIDKAENEADTLSVTATVGPTVMDKTRGVQLTLKTPEGYSYARVSQQQIQDLITVLERRIDADNEDFEATTFGADRTVVEPNGDKIDMEP